MPNEALSAIVGAAGKAVCGSSMFGSVDLESTVAMHLTHCVALKTALTV